MRVTFLVLLSINFNMQHCILKKYNAEDTRCYFSTLSFMSNIFLLGFFYSFILKVAHK